MHKKLKMLPNKIEKWIDLVMIDLVLEHEGDNDFEAFHSQVRLKQQNGQLLNRVRPNLREIRRLQRIVRDYFDNE